MNLFGETFAWLATPANWAGTGGITVRIVEHLLITVVAVTAAGLIGLPAGIAAGHTGRGAGLIAGIAGAARAVPTLGLLTITALGAGIGLAAPMVALIILALPSILAGAYAGVQSVDPATVDAALAQGMTPRQLIRLVELPLAGPVILGGLRAATLQVVATATLAAYISDYGLGRYLFTGLKSRDYPQMLAGSLLVTTVALLLELGLARLQRAAARHASPQDRTTKGTP